MHEVRAFGAADPVVQQLAQRLERKVLLLERRDAAEELVAQDVQARLRQAGGHEQIDHLRTMRDS